MMSWRQHMLLLDLRVNCSTSYIQLVCACNSVLCDRFASIVTYCCVYSGGSLYTKNPIFNVIMYSKLKNIEIANICFKHFYFIICWQRSSNYLSLFIIKNSAFSKCFFHTWNNQLVVLFILLLALHFSYPFSLVFVAEMNVFNEWN